MISKTDIDQAYERIRGEIFRTPIVYSAKLSDLCGCRLFLKLENFQTTGSFKERGALNRLLTLSPEEREIGVVAASAGNHAQGVAYHARRLGIRSTIVMPVGTPLIKVVSTQKEGAMVILHGEAIDDAYELALELSRKNGLVLVHPFMDPLVIAGQGTIAREILEDESSRKMDAVICPIGGGGLIAGIATYVKETNPQIKVFGVEAAACPAMKASLEHGRLIHLPAASSLADGIAVKQVGQINFEIAKKYVDEVAAVDEDEIADAVLLLLEIEKIVTEGAGAVPIAALLNHKIDLPGKNVLAVISGGNIDVNILDKIITRGLAVQGRIAQLTIPLRDIPGTLSGIVEIIKGMQVNILDIIHHRFESTAPFGYVDVSFTLETKGHDHIEEIKRVLGERGFPASSECTPPPRRRPAGLT
jgi:threonine dehydratase